MPVEKTERDVRTLVAQISAGEIKLPEIQRGYVWKPTQVAALVSSMYRGWPAGSLLFWDATETPATREMDIRDGQATAAVSPLYLLDGQQRLTSIHRVFTDHQSAQIAFNVETEQFQNHSATTRKDRRWVGVWDVIGPDADLFATTQAVSEALAGRFDQRAVFDRLSQLAAIGQHVFRMEILKRFSYDDVTKIFATVNSGGRSLKTADLALATLSAHWPGVTNKLADEAAYWTSHDYPDLDTNFLTRALTGAVLGRGLSAWSHSRLVQATHEQLDRSWATVQRGLRHLVPLLKTRLGVDTSSVMPSHNVLIPLVVLLGERPDVPMSEDDVSGVLYFVLAATFRTRYSASVDTTLGQDIPAARTDSPVQSLLANLALERRPLTITPGDLAGRTTGSPSFFLSYLTFRARGARDWWFGNIVQGTGTDGARIEFHHVHPQYTLRSTGLFTKAQINDLANFAFISARANRTISSRSPREYFPELSAEDRAAHLLPVAQELLDASNYLAFLDARRVLLAQAMQEFVDGFRPSWIAGDDADSESRAWAVDLVILLSPDGVRTLKVEVDGGVRWTGHMDFDDLIAALEAADDGIPSDVELGPDQLGAVTIEEENIELRVGPVVLTGTKDEWDAVVDREVHTGDIVEAAPGVVSDPLPEGGEPVRFPILETS